MKGRLKPKEIPLPAITIKINHSEQPERGDFKIIFTEKYINCREKNEGFLHLDNPATY